MITRIKICCISSLDEAMLAVNLGVDALGLVSEMPSGPGIIPEAQIHDIVSALPPAVSSFLLTSKTTANEVIAQQNRTGVNTLQLVDYMETVELKKLREHLPGIKLVQVIHVQSVEDINRALMYEPYCDALLLDSGNPNKEIKELGGTGRTHNWDISQKIVERTEKPVFLAGGLKTGNLPEAIEKVKPFAVDVCSGVRTNGVLDPVKLKQFIQICKK